MKRADFRDSVSAIGGIGLIVFVGIKLAIWTGVISESLNLSALILIQYIALYFVLLWGWMKVFPKQGFRKEKMTIEDWWKIGFAVFLAVGAMFLVWISILNEEAILLAVVAAVTMGFSIATASSAMDGES